MTDTLRSVLVQGARRYLDKEISSYEFMQGLILAIGECPEDSQKMEDLQWLAVKLTSGS